MHDRACCTCDEHRSLSKAQFEMYERINTRLTLETFMSMVRVYYLIDNNNGDTGATSLSEALKSNTTLTELNLDCSDTRKKTHKRHPSTMHSFHFSSQQQGTTLEK